MEEKIEKSLFLCICFFVQSSLCDPHEYNFADPEFFRFRLVQSHPGHAHLIAAQSPEHLRSSFTSFLQDPSAEWDWSMAPLMVEVSLPGEAEPYEKSF